MKVLLEEYGKLILYAVLGAVVLKIVFVGIGTWYESTYPTIDSYNGILVESSINEPIIVCDNIEIKKKIVHEDIDFTNYIKAYSNSSMEEELEIVINGEDTVDVTSCGIYQIVCSATNSSGYTFSKIVPILVY